MFKDRMDFYGLRVQLCRRYQKSFKPKEPPPDVSPPDDPGNPTVDFHGEKRSNATHESQTDPQARLYRKGPGHEAKPTPGPYPVA